MSMQLRAFRPFGDTSNTAIGTTAAFLSANHPGTCSARLANVGTQTIFVKVDGTTATLANGIPLFPNTAQIFTIAPSEGNPISAIASAVGSTLYVTFGEGM